MELIDKKKKLYDEIKENFKGITEEMCPSY